jgi:hypothetical protein
MDSQTAAEYSPWEEWKPEDYLNEYYVDVESDEFYLLEFLVEIAPKLPPVSVALDYGCGPTLHRLFPLVPYVGEIHLAEYLSANRDAIRLWLEERAGAHDWTPHTKETLRLEGDPSPSADAVRERESQTRRKITELMPTDAYQNDPLGPERRGFYPLVTTHYCADGATDNLETWKQFMRNIASLVKPGGIFISSSIVAADRYKVGERWYPSPQVTEVDVAAWMRAEGFYNLDLRVRNVDDRGEKGYEGVLFAMATKRG